MTLQPIEAELRHPEPEEVVEVARRQADVLIKLVEDRGLFLEIEGKRYLFAEAWETIGAFNQVSANTVWVKAVLGDGGETVGYDALVNLISTVDGSVRGSGIMRCGLDDFPCRGRQGTAQHKAAMSAAQTWALSKAYRMNFSFVVVLAGFQATPADEMAGTPPSQAVIQQEGTMCPLHPGMPLRWNTNAKGSWWSHKLGGGWCNPKGLAPPASAKPEPAKRSDVESPEEAEVAFLAELTEPLPEDAERWGFKDEAPPADAAKHEEPTG
jgi:hypothetical protein